jgi:hypothetical protein
MKKAGYASLLIVLALGGFLYGSALNRRATATSAGARSAEESDSRAGASWAYAAVSRAGYTGSSRGGTYWISYFKETGVEIVEIEEKVSEQQGAQIARAIARLGEEGWEMVGGHLF